MKVMLVNGAPHKNGCTYTALSEVAKTLNELGIDTEIFWIGNKPMGGCIACKNCVVTGKCFESGRSAGVDMPERELAVFTNFVR